MTKLLSSFHTAGSTSSDNTLVSAVCAVHLSALSAGLHAVLATHTLQAESLLVLLPLEKHLLNSGAVCVQQCGFCLPA